MFLAGEKLCFMKNMILLSALIAALGLALADEAGACTSRDAAFTLGIGNLNINFKELNETCTRETCAFSQRYIGPRVYSLITIRSAYDERVSLVITNTPDESNSLYDPKWGIIVRLPYVLKEEWAPVASGIEPAKYNWKEAVKTDLVSLKKKGVLTIQDADIDAISAQAANGKKVFYCKNAWKALESNCDCSHCVKCGGAPILGASAPPKQLITPTTAPPTTKLPPATMPPASTTVKTTTTTEPPITEEPTATTLTPEPKTEKGLPNLALFFLLLAIIIVVIAAAVFLRKNKKPEEPPKTGLRGL